MGPERSGRCDVIDQTADFCPYHAIIMPLLPMVFRPTKDRLKQWVQEGGHLLLGPWTGHRTEELTAWTDQEFVGLEFATPLAEAVLERLLQDQAHMPETTINELRQIATRTHGLARQAGDDDIHPLAELSRKCAVDAVVEGFRMSEATRAKSAKPRKKPSADA